MRHIDSLASLLVVVVMLLAGVFLLVPMIVTVVMSFDERSYLGAFPPMNFSFRWYEAFFSNMYFISSLKTSLFLAVATTVISTSIGSLAALAIHTASFRGRDIVAAVLLTPLVIPSVVIGFALLLFLSTLGIYDGFWRLLAGHVIVTLPYTVRTTLAGLAGIKPSLAEAALSLGANERQAFWDVTFPLARTGIVAGAIFAFTFSVDEVAVSLFLADPKTVTLPVALISMMRSNFDLTIAAAAVLLIVVAGMVILALDRVIGFDRLVGRGVYHY